MNKYFYNTSVTSPLMDSIFEDINLNNIKFTPTVDNIQLVGRGVPQGLIQQDKFLTYLNSHVKDFGKLELFKFPAMTYYFFHIDVYNKYNFNYTFETYNSFSLFKATDEDTVSETKLKSNFNVVDLPYTPKTWYLFNAQIPHGVFNLDVKDRYLLSFTVSKDCELSYLEMLEISKNFKIY
jgi:hypothetical protein